MIRSSSRYADVALTSIDGVLTISNRPRNLRGRFHYKNYRVKETDRLDNLAYEKLGDQRDWYMLADANPENLYPVPEPGTKIRIPYESLL